MTSTANAPSGFTCGTLTYTRRGLVALFAWMLWGDVCFTLMETVVPSILPLKLRSLESSNLIIGLIMTTLPGIFNVTITPWLSFKSDRHRGRWGRRLPFILSTMPFLAGVLLLIAYSDSLGAWAHGAFFSGSGIRQARVVIVLLAIFAGLFDLFNMFVNTVFWYLFRDVVPETHLTRFNAWFRIVSTLTGAGYNFFVFKYAESHMREIFVCAALLYLFGFGLMCLKVKEGEYPPVADVTERTSILDQLKIYGRECFSIRYYWDIFLWLTFQSMSFACGVYGVFFNKSLGLDLDLIGKMGAVGAVAGPICLFVMASRVERWHPIRVTAYCSALSAFTAFGGWFWLFVLHPPTLFYFWSSIIIGTIFGSLLGAAGNAAGGPLLMFLFPRDKYGQFCGAMAFIRSFSIMASGALAGLFLDFWKHLYPENDFCYRFIFLWSGSFNVLSFYFFYRVYRTWKRLGGVEHYVPPETNIRLADLPPRTDYTSCLHPWMIRITILAFVGWIVSRCAWVVYYRYYEIRPDYVIVCLVGLGIDIMLYLAYLRFMKFMERP